MIYSRTMTVLAPSPAPGAAVTPASALERSIHGPETPFTRWLVRWRYWFFAAIAVLIVVQFNGQWRVGLDSSIYRGVGDNLAAGHGYTFAGRRQTQVYPGLPVVLAVLDRVFGTNSVVPPLVLMNALAVLTLVGVYHLIKLRYPLWVAVVVTCGVGMNSRFVQQAQEVMTDTPFLCAVVMALLGWELLGVARGGRKTAGAVALLAGGLFAAATMRPTFWVLAAAWAAVALWGAAVRRERRGVIALGVLAVVLVAFMAVDPRVRGLRLLQGGYEQQFFQTLGGASAQVAKNAPNLFRREIPEAFFGEGMTGLAVPFVLLLGAGSLLVLRRQPLWGLQVFLLTGVMLMLSDVPRYYLMVLPTLWLAYVLGLLALTAWAHPRVRDLTLFALFSVANFQNLGGCLRLFTEQHAKNFDATYKRGTYEPLREMAAVLKTRMGPDDVAVGPTAQILSYLSGRNVVNGRLLGFETQPITRYPQQIAAAKPDFVIGPLSAYEKKDTEMYRLLAAGVIVPGKLVAKTPDLWLAEATVHVPGGDWRKQPTTRPRPLSATTRPAHRPAAEQANRDLKAKRLRKAIRADRAAEADRRQRKLRRQRRTTTTKAVATQPFGLAAPPDRLGTGVADRDAFATPEGIQ